MPKVKTDDMAGAALEWAVAQAVGIQVTIVGHNVMVTGWDNDYEFVPVSDWNQCGLLISAYKIMVYPSMDVETGDVLHWVAVFERITNRQWRRGWLGATALEAICRAVVGNKLGAEVDVPAELVEAS